MHGSKVKIHRIRTSKEHSSLHGIVWCNFTLSVSAMAPSDDERHLQDALAFFTIHVASEIPKNKIIIKPKGDGNGDE
ncbi:hypothetical protein VNO77_03440 [Canavalia gladiata]|uniref:Uncharacterized protein n=1 Tax=Canavalia gladiata TaxID=3824 RepID=A0AAN9R858_CANGL